MIKAVIFDMYETLITQYRSPVYFGMQMAEDAGIEGDIFDQLWESTEPDRTMGLLTMEEALEKVLKENACYSEELLQKLVAKRKAAKRECFAHLHPQIIPMLDTLKKNDLRIALISNCYSEEAEVIRESRLFPYFDQVNLSCELNIQKPDAKIFQRCLEGLQVKAEECVYTGDGGNSELEAARGAGMRALQAGWYIKNSAARADIQKNGFDWLDSPLEILPYCL